VTDWQILTLADLCDVAPGPSGTYQGDLVDNGEGIPMIMQIGPNNTVEPRGIRVVSRRHAGDLAKFQLADGDVLCVRQGSLGRFALIGAEHAGWTYGSACIRLRVHDRHAISPDYLLRYLLHAPVREALISRANPGTVSTIRAADLAELAVALPPLAHQRAVAGALDAIDDQIETARRLAEKLESQRSALMTEFIGENLPVEVGAGTAITIDRTVRRGFGRMS